MKRKARVSLPAPPAVYCPECGCTFFAEPGEECPCCGEAELKLCSAETDALEREIESDPDVAKEYCPECEDRSVTGK